MMTYLYVAVGSWSCGLATALSIAWGVKRRLVKRLNARAGTLAVIRDLESRRVAYDTGREHLVRANAGRAAVVSDGMATKPGSLARYHRDTGPTKSFPGERG